MSPLSQESMISKNDNEFIQRLILRTLGSLCVNTTQKGGAYIYDVLFYLLRAEKENVDIADALANTSVKYAIDTESIRAAMRYTVAQAWKVGDPEVQYSYFGRSVQFGRGKPTESAFIATLVMKMSHEIKAYRSTHQLDDGLPPEMKI